ncbi:MAG: DUF4493 domain-containing protein [Bacteroidaceae bacterium]|nr:DUF4493 domain-containing protein [Bacteroidaceae bacterium]
MKLNKIFLGCAAAMALASCVNEDFSKSVGKDSGHLEVGVEILEPMKTRADEYTVTNFPVTIYEADGTTKVVSYDAVSAMPAQILLPTGDYVLEAHTPGVMDRIMDAPYYKGTEPSVIQKDLTTQSTITCKMANTSITVHYDQDFLDLFTSWTITFDDGTDNAISFTNEDGETPSTLYWDLGEGVEKLKVNFRGVNRDGTITASMDLTKSQATETYDGQNINFAGGDAVVVNFTPTEATSGYVTVIITANIFGTDAESVPAVVEIVDNGTFTPDDGSGDEPGPQPGDDDAIVLTLPDHITFTMGEGATLDKSLGNVFIEAENGIKSLMVTAESTNPDMVESLVAVGAGYGLDFVSAGVEVVDNTDLVNFFSGLGQSLSVPTQGDESYQFPVGNFFVLLDVMSGTHTFHLTATDMNGNTKSGNVIVTVNE